MSPSRETELRQLIAKPFAHRGLHGSGRIENSRAAFQAAIEARHGIELDVQITGDGQAIVFHDEWLHRLSVDEGVVRGRTAAELARIRLRDSDETIPSLPEILALIAGRAPLLIEAKSPNREVSALCRAVSDALKGYIGPVAVMYVPKGPMLDYNDPLLLDQMLEKLEKLALRNRADVSLWSTTLDPKMS